MLPRLIIPLAEHVAFGQNCSDASIGSVFVCILTECRQTRQFSSPFHRLAGLYRLNDGCFLAVVDKYNGKAFFLPLSARYAFTHIHW